MDIESRLNNYDKFGIKLGLEPIANVLKILGNPQDMLTVIHIAGTNGKGSTLSIIEAVLIENGNTVCKYTSPYMFNLREMFVYNQQFFADKKLLEKLTIIEDVLSENNLSLSRYEVTTVMMLLLAADVKPDFVLLETGMGGRLDATNVVDADYTLITNVTRDHTQYLGNTLEEIALEKAAIVKDLAYVARLTPALAAGLTGKEIIETSKIEHSYNLNSRDFTTEITVDKMMYKLSLFGTHQVENFLLAYKLLTDLGLKRTTIASGVKKVSWPGRIQVLRTSPLLIYDGAHNQDACQVLVSSLQGQQFTIFFATFSDKDYLSNFNTLTAIATEFIYVELVDERGLSYQQFSLETGQNIPVISELELSNLLKDLTKPALVCGTLSLLKNINI